MQRKRLEALAEAIVHVSGYQIPGSTLYLARNPGGLRAFKPEHQRDTDGNRVFGSVIDGLQALLFDTALKLEGMSRHCLQPSSTLQDFAVTHNHSPAASVAYLKFLRKALQDQSLDAKTTLAYFLDETL